MLARATPRSRAAVLGCDTTMRPFFRISAWLPLLSGFALLVVATRTGAGAFALVALAFLLGNALATPSNMAWAEPSQPEASPTEEASNEEAPNEADKLTGQFRRVVRQNMVPGLACGDRAALGSDPGPQRWMRFLHRE